MNNYITGSIIKELRIKKNLTQKELADILSVSDKTISKWETGKGFPDISLIEPLSTALSVSVAELFSGELTINKNVSANMIKAKLYVCPICGNVIISSGDVNITCCGITLPPLEAEEIDENHEVKIENIEDEIFVTISHPMEKSHYISFVAFVSGDKFDFRKLYPESNPETRLKKRGHGFLYIYCNKHGLFKIKL